MGAHWRRAAAAAECAAGGRRRRRRLVRGRDASPGPPAHPPVACATLCPRQVARVAHDKYGGEAGLLEHVHAKLDAKLQAKLRVRAPPPAWLLPAQRCRHALRRFPTDRLPRCPCPPAAWRSAARRRSSERPRRRRACSASGSACRRRRQSPGAAAGRWRAIQKRSEGVAALPGLQRFLFAPVQPLMLCTLHANTAHS